MAQNQALERVAIKKDARPRYGIKNEREKNLTQTRDTNSLLCGARATLN